MPLSKRIASILATRQDHLAPSRTDIAQHAMRCLDLTTLTGVERPADIEAICHNARAARVAAVCVYPQYISAVRQGLEGTTIHAASVAMNFPTADGPLHERLQDIARARADGADEIDIVFPLALVHEERWDALAHEFAQAREQAGQATLKIILESGMLPSQEHLYRSARIALDAGADFLKTSTGKRTVGATHEAVATLLLALTDHGSHAGIKISGGLRQLDDLLPYMRMIYAHGGDAALAPTRFRIGASSLLTALQEACKGAENA